MVLGTVQHRKPQAATETLNDPDPPPGLLNTFHNPSSIHATSDGIT